MTRAPGILPRGARHLVICSDRDLCQLRVPLMDFREVFPGGPVLSKTTFTHQIGIFMDTMTYASFPTFRANVADKSNQPVLRETEFIPLDLSQITVTQLRRDP